MNNFEKLDIKIDQCVKSKMITDKSNFESLQESSRNLERDMLALKNQHIRENRVTDLRNSDFTEGTLLIKNPGYYRLVEDIVFNPNNLQQLQAMNPAATYWDAGFVAPHQFQKYDPAAFGIGFFAAIAICGEDIILDLNGFRLEQSKEHALHQRFFALIELADRPFIPNQGPHDFGSRIKSAKNCAILNGTLGRSSHHGIHGNDNQRILIQDVDFIDFEVAGSALNGCRDIVMKNCKALRNRIDIPVLGTFSAARFLRAYLEHMVTNNHDTTLKVKNETMNATTIRNNLKGVVNQAYQEILEGTGKILSDWPRKIFHNATGLIDGNGYGFLINNRGIAVNDFPSQPSNFSQNIYFENVSVDNLWCNINEIPAIGNINANSGYAQGVMNDSVGSVFQIMNKNPDNGNYITISNLTDGYYQGNPVSNAQLLVAKAIHEGKNFGRLSTKRNSITMDAVNWAESYGTAQGKLKNLLENEYIKGLRGNGDSMFHVNKGVVAFKMDAIDNLIMKDCVAKNIKNLGKSGIYLANNSDYNNGIGISHPLSHYPGYRGADIRGFSFASTTRAYLEMCKVFNCWAEYGSAYGMDAHLNSKGVYFISPEITNVKSAEGKDLDLYNNNPTEKPIAAGMHIQEMAKETIIVDAKITGTHGLFKSLDYLIQNNTNECVII